MFAAWAAAVMADLVTCSTDRPNFEFQSPDPPKHLSGWCKSEQLFRQAPVAHTNSR
jgi:hypothetical protein